MWHNNNMYRKILLMLPVLFIFSCASIFRAEPPKSPDIPKEAYYHYILGYEAELSGKWEDALNNYSKALKIDPASPYIRTQISYVLLRSGKIPDAIAMTEETVKANPDYVPALMLLGELYNSQKNTDKAIRIFESA